MFQDAYVYTLATVYKWKSEDNSEESVLFYHVGPGRLKRQKITGEKGLFLGETERVFPIEKRINIS